MESMGMKFKAIEDVKVGVNPSITIQIERNIDNHGKKEIVVRCEDNSLALERDDNMMTIAKSNEINPHAIKDHSTIVSSQKPLSQWKDNFTSISANPSHFETIKIDKLSRSSKSIPKSKISRKSEITSDKSDMNSLRSETIRSQKSRINESIQRHNEMIQDAHDYFSQKSCYKENSYQQQDHSSYGQSTTRSRHGARSRNSESKF